MCWLICASLWPQWWRLEVREGSRDYVIVKDIIWSNVEIISEAFSVLQSIGCNCECSWSQRVSASGKEDFSICNCPHLQRAITRNGFSPPQAWKTLDLKLIFRQYTRPMVAYKSHCTYRFKKRLMVYLVWQGFMGWCQGRVIKRRRTYGRQRRRKGEKSSSLKQAQKMVSFLKEGTGPG